MNVAILQMQVALGKPALNMDTLRKLAAQAMTTQPDVLLLPELWLQGFYPRPLVDYADQEGAQARALLSGLAQKYQVNIVGGTVACAHNGQIFNRCYIWNRQGRLITSYDKMHLFSPSGEHEDFTPGDSLVTFTIDDVKCGIIVCYDLRFPELSRALALADIQVLFIPAAWPAKRLHHWQTLLQARAIENQFFVATCNSEGHSALIDPWGKILAAAALGQEIITAPLPLNLQAQIKAQLDVFNDRRPELYHKFNL